MKKLKFLPSVLMLALCLAVLAVGIYAIKPTQNTLEGSITIGATNPAVDLTVYYVPDGVTVEDAVLDDANKIGTTKTARYGVKLDLTDTRLDFSMDNVNTLSDVKAKNIAIKIENTSAQVLGAYFTDDVETAEVKTTLPLSTYNSSTTFTEETLMPGYAQADFSKYTEVPAKEGEVNGEAIVTMSISLLDLSTVEIYIDIDAILIVEAFDESKYVEPAMLALNVTEEVTYTPETLSTTETVMDAEVYDVSGNGSFCLGLVNFKYDESETAALSANGNSVKASLLIEETSTASKTASFNLSVTVGDDSTPTTAADLAENFVLIKGNFNGMAGFIANMPPEEDMLELGADYIVEESTITLLTNLDSSVFEFCIYYLSESGMKLHLSVPEGEDKIKLMTPTATIQYEESVNIDGSVDATFTFVEEPTQISKGERTENVSISNIYLKNIPGFETLSAVNIVTSITYGSIFLMDAGLLSLASGEGVSLSDLIGMMDSLSAQIGMYASIGFQNTNGGTTFEVLDTYLTDGNKSLVLIILSDELTKTVNFGLQMIEEVDPLAYTLSTDSTTGETYYSVTGMRAQVDSFKVPATYQGIPVKEIAAETFKNSEITAVDLSGASNLTTIGDSAFSYCQNLETVITSDSITTIGEEAFYDCKSLLSITMPEYVTTISEFAFSGCESLLSIAIPENVTTIENHAFSRCKGLTEINYNATNLTTAISTNGACLFSYAGHQAEDGITVNIGANVLNIPSGLFYDNSYLSSANIKRVIFKEGSLCESIGDSSFSGCIYLTSINIPDSVTSIGMNAFSTCVRLQNITIPESVTSIGNYAFFNCYALAEVYNLSALNIVKGEFTFGCVANYAKVVYTSLDAETRIIEENGVKYYKYEDAKIALCTTNKNFTTISLADDCTQINQGAFYYCSNLESITIPEEVTGIGEHAFYWCSSLADIIIPESVTSIGSHAFWYCTGLTEITIPSNVTIINDNTFLGCNNLTNITIPNKVTDIGVGAFYNCSSLTSIVIPESVTSIGGGAFNSCKRLSSITIPDSVISIGARAFYGCTGLTEITLPFVGNGSDQTHFGYIFGASDYYYNKDYVPSSLKTVVITNTQTIGDSAFYECAGLTSITMPDTVTTIAVKAFQSCTGLTNITIPDGVTSIDSYAFEGCTGITTVTIPAGVTNIEMYAFQSCTGLTNVIIQEGVVSIGTGAFRFCMGLTSIVIPSSITSIEVTAFEGCDVLAEVYNLSNLEILAGADTYGEVALNAKVVHESANAESRIIEENGVIYYDYENDKIALRPIDRNATTITLAEDCTEVYQSAFHSCKNLSSIIIPEGVTKIGLYAFHSCESLTSITIPSSVISIDAGAFLMCTNLATIDLSQATSLESIGALAFGGCTSLTSITIPSSVATIGESAFGACSSLATITVKEGTETSFACTLPYDYTLTNGETSTSVAEGTAIARAASGDNVYTKK